MDVPDLSRAEIAPIVRIPEPDPYRACMALDGGASGIIAPYVETPEQVRKLYGAVKLRPVKGAVLEARIQGSMALPGETGAYVDQRNADNVLIINIESTPALANLDAILEVPGIDAVLVGPHDLSCSLGVPEQYTHPLFLEKIRYISPRRGSMASEPESISGMTGSRKWSGASWARTSSCTPVISRCSRKSCAKICTGFAKHSAIRRARTTAAARQRCDPERNAGRNRGGGCSCRRRRSVSRGF